MGKIPYSKCFPLFGCIILFSTFLLRQILNLELRLFPLRQNYRKKLNVWKKVTCTRQLPHLLCSVLVHMHQSTGRPTSYMTRAYCKPKLAGGTQNEMGFGMQ